MMLSDWACVWNIPPAALLDLRYRYLQPVSTPIMPGMNETEISKQIQLAASRQGARLWRNNSGMAVSADGRKVRFGLGNISKKINNKFKSSDLIGITPIVIGPELYGHTVGVFTSVETKRPGFKYTGKGREVAQKAWIDVILSLGGFAKFATGPEDI